MRRTRGGSTIAGVVDLFSGAGGFSRGFSEAGYRILAGVDSERSAIRSFKANFPQAVALQEDVQDLSGRDLEILVGGRPLVVIGGPPCEAFTGANPERMARPLDRLYKDPLGRLVLHFARLVSELEPQVFVMENVPAIMDNPLREALEDLFHRAGYEEIHFNILRAEDHGVPSRRTRVFISNLRIRPPKEPGKTVGEALENMPPPGQGVPNHEPVPLSPRRARRISRVGAGDPLYMYRGAGGRILPNYVRLDPGDWAPTVMGSSRFIHPFEDRLLTVREQARLMGFPDDHVFIGGRDSQFNQVGEAVPPPLARAIALEISKILVLEDLRP